MNQEKSHQYRSFFDVVEEIIHHDLKNLKKFGKDFRREFEEAFGKDCIKSTPLINIIEAEQAYHIQVAAPGLKKEQFSISLKDKLLTISVSEETTLGENEKYKKREFNFSKFQRSITLPEDADTDNISAHYEDGILTISVLKIIKSTTEREITVS